MISSLSGLVKVIKAGSVIIEVGGVGLQVSVAPRISAAFSVGSYINLQTILVVREDSLTLYGFENESDREIFELLQTVTGIGPKVAQSALNIYETPALVYAILNEEPEKLERIPGLGKKGAQRVVLELRDKVSHFQGSNSPNSDSWRDQISSALLGLGFGSREVLDRIEHLAKSFNDISSVPITDLLRAALTGVKDE